jgi:hypothetical protein
MDILSDPSDDDSTAAWLTKSITKELKSHCPLCFWGGKVYRRPNANDAINEANLSYDAPGKHPCKFMFTERESTDAVRIG